MGVTCVNITNGGPTWIARYRNQSRAFCVSAHGEVEAKRLAEEAFANYGLTNANGRAFVTKYRNKKYDLMTNMGLYWRPSRTTDKPYPYLIVCYSLTAGTQRHKTFKMSLAKHGIKNSVIKACKHLLQAGYPEVLESKLADEVRTALLTSYVEQGFDLKLIPDFY